VLTSFELIIVALMFEVKPREGLGRDSNAAPLDGAL
jgi:hypothetical protein